jgi:hypothetical protein
MGEELSLVKFFSVQFFHVLFRNNIFTPVTTHLIKILECLVKSETETDDKTKEMIERIKWIRDNTHERVKKPLAVMELAVFRNLNKTLSGELEISNRTFQMVDLYKYLDEVVVEMTLMVVEIAKKYSFDMPMNLGNVSRGGDTGVNFNAGS